MTLKQKALNGVKWTSISTVYAAVLQLLQLLIITRYLSATELGLLAIIMIILGFSQMFSDLSISNAIIHKQNVSHSQLSTLYWFNIIISFFVFVIIIILAPYIANFYNNSKLENLIFLAAFSIIIQSFGKQFQILFDKELLFNFLAKIRMITITITFFSTITLVIMGYGIWSLVISILLSSSISTVLYISFGLKFHRPTMIFNLKDSMFFLNFGFLQLGSSTLSYLNSQMDSLIIGKLLGNEALGIYSVLKQIVEAPGKIINPVVTRVSFPTMAKIQHEPLKVKEVYLKTINYISSFTFPIYAVFFILSAEIVELFLGTKWEQTTPILQILSLYFLFRSIGNPIGSLVLAKGKPIYELYWNLGMMIYTPLILIISSQWDLIGVAYGLLFWSTSLMVPNWFFLVRKLCGAKFNEYFLEIARSLIIAFLASLIVVILNSFIAIIWLKLISTIMVGLIILILLNVKYNNDFIKVIKAIIKVRN